MSKTFHKRGSLRLAGYLIDGHGDPISDAHVVLDGLSYTLSDHSGLFVFDGLASDSYCLDAYSQTHHLPPVLICVRERVEPIRLRMFAAGRLRVRVTDGNVPIEGAQLMRRAELAAVTDENGSACITGLGGSLELFYVHAKGYASTDWGTDHDRCSSSGGHRRHKLALTSREVRHVNP